MGKNNVRSKEPVNDTSTSNETKRLEAPIQAVPGIGAWRLLVDAAGRVPGGNWVFATVAVGAAAAITIGLLRSTRLAFFGVLFAFAFTVLFYAFAKGTEHIKKLVWPITVLVWSVTIMFICTLVTIFSCVFFTKPRDLSHWLDASPKPAANPAGSSLIGLPEDGRRNPPAATTSANEVLSVSAIATGEKQLPTPAEKTASEAVQRLPNVSVIGDTEFLPKSVRSKLISTLAVRQTCEMTVRVAPHVGETARLFVTCTCDGRGPSPESSGTSFTSAQPIEEVIAKLKAAAKGAGC